MHIYTKYLYINTLYLAAGYRWRLINATITSGVGVNYQYFNKNWDEVHSFKVLIVVTSSETW